MTDRHQDSVAERWDTALDALSNSYRRQLLLALSRANPQDASDVDPMDTLSRPETDADKLQIEMFHTHLPKLESMGFIEWDRAAGEVRKGPDWDEIGPLLQLIQDHSDDLPDDWL